MQSMRITVQQSFPRGPVLNLRAEGFIWDDRLEGTPITDEFDACGRTRHLTIESAASDGILGAARVTLGSASQPGVISEWTGLTLPDSGRLIELSRVVVRPECRRQGIFGLMVVLALDLAKAEGRDGVVAVAKAGLPTTMYLEYALGFEFCVVRGRGKILCEDILGQQAEVRLLRNDAGDTQRLVAVERAPIPKTCGLLVHVVPAQYAAIRRQQKGRFATYSAEGARSPWRDTLFRQWSD